MKLLVRKYPNMLSKKIVTILEDEIIIGTIEEPNKLKFNIKDIYKVININDSLYIYDDKNVLYIIIPLSSFNENIDKEKLLMLLQAFIK